MSAVVGCKMVVAVLRDYKVLRYKPIFFFKKKKNNTADGTRDDAIIIIKLYLLFFLFFLNVLNLMIFISSKIFSCVVA